VLAFCTLAFVALAGSRLQAVPISISFDNANQTVAAPSNGFITVIITGTVSIDPGYHLIGVALDSPTNLAHTNSLNIDTSLAFFQFQLQGTGTFTGAILEITVPAGTPPDFYGYRTNDNNPARFGIGVAPNVGGAPTSAEQNYSVTVTQGTAVPDNDETFLLLMMSSGILLFARRIFPLKAWPATA
jgi:hypothetical protein